ncbi:hypothetical protein GX48_03969 [Paracoccidioides brasiliensis]|nr:hypothetical protein GX48_03969 [Paracoccidioides brasiliensis]
MAEFTGLSWFNIVEWHLIAIAMSLIIIQNLCRSIYRTIKSPFPGPKLAKFTKWWLTLHELRDGILNTTHHAHQIYGPIVQLGPKMISFCHPDALRDIYTGPHGGLDTFDLVWFFEQYGSQNLVSTIDPELHLMRRKTVAGLYTNTVVSSPAVQALMKTVINTFMDEIEREATAAAGELPPRTVDVFPLIRWFTADIMTGLIYGPGKPLNLLKNADSRTEMAELLTSNTDQVASLFAIILQLFPLSMLKLLSPLINPGTKMAAYGMSRVKESLRLRSQSSNDDHGVTHDKNEIKAHLHHLLHLFKKNGPSPALPNVNYIASDSLDHFFAGTSTTADFLSALIYRLSLPENKRHQDNLRDELRSITSKDPTASLEDISLSDLQSLPFLTSVLQETFRTNPPIPFSLLRVVKAKNPDITVLGIKIEPGTTISIQPYTLHRDPEIFPNPDVWDPERWRSCITTTTTTASATTSTSTSTSQKHRQMQRMLMPFGYGARTCTGINLAWAIIRLVTARMYSTYKTSLDEGVWFEEGKKGEVRKKKYLYPDDGVQPVVFRRV